MVFLMLFLVCVFAALGACFVGAWSDFKGLKIPNIYTVIVLLTFVVSYGALYLGGVDFVFLPIVSHLLSAVIVFGVTALMFSFSALGAADSKLGTAVALWVGMAGLPVFLFWMAVAGGVLGVLALIFKRYKPVKSPPKNSWIDQVQGGASKVPYGIAIAVGAVVAFVKVGYLNIDILQRIIGA